jgi:outer membrane protein OmpA-like peptidoglycan-associated protein
VAALAQQFGNARIIVEGHTDASMKGQAPAELVKELSLARAAAVKNELIRQFEFDDNRFAVDGLGWERPADPDRPGEHALNRRVEIKVYSAERE